MIPIRAAREAGPMQRQVVGAGHEGEKIGARMCSDILKGASRGGMLMQCFGEYSNDRITSILCRSGSI